MLGQSERDDLDERLRAYMDTQLQEPVDIGLPDLSPAAPPGPTGSRKRARPAAAAKPTEADLIAGAEAAVLEAEKALKKASKHAERAKAKLSGPSSFQKYNELLHEYYRAEFMLLHDRACAEGCRARSLAPAVGSRARAQPNPRQSTSSWNSPGFPPDCPPDCPPIASL